MFVEDAEIKIKDYNKLDLSSAKSAEANKTILISDLCGVLQDTGRQCKHKIQFTSLAGRQALYRMCSGAFTVLSDIQ